MKSVVICGSRRFKIEMRELTYALRENNVVVYEPYLYDEPEDVRTQLDERERDYIALGLTHDHFYKIRMADVVYIYNSDGYLGNSTTMELGYAVAMNKPIYAFSGLDPERSRRVLYRAIISSAKELLPYLL